MGDVVRFTGAEQRGIRPIPGMAAAMATILRGYMDATVRLAVLPPDRIEAELEVIGDALRAEIIANGETEDMAGWGREQYVDVIRGSVATMRQMAKGA